MTSIQTLLPSGVLIVFTAVAVWTDLRAHRISNRLVVAALLSAFALRIAGQGWTGALDAAGGAAVGFAVFIPFYLLKGMGAADVKWMAAVGAFFEPATAALAAGMTLIAGSVLALGLLWLERVWPVGWLTAPAAATGAGRRFAYAPAIAAGALATLYLAGAG